MERPRITECCLNNEQRVNTTHFIEMSIVWCTNIESDEDVCPPDIDSFRGAGQWRMTQITFGTGASLADDRRALYMSPCFV